MVVKLADDYRVDPPFNKVDLLGEQVRMTSRLALPLGLKTGQQGAGCWSK